MTRLATKSVLYLHRLLDVVFVDGFGLLHSNVKVKNIIDVSDEMKDIIVEENILLPAVYAIIEKENKIILEISNNGIPMETNIDVFRKFYSTKNKKGLSLYIAKRNFLSVNKDINLSQNKVSITMLKEGV